MPEQIYKKTTKKIKENAHQAAHVEGALAPVRRYRTALFQTMLLLFAGAFGVLTFLVKTTPSFAIDLQITTTIQLINLPYFAALMSAISWAGFIPQAVIITALIIVLIDSFGLRWEAVMALVATAFSTGVNLLVKELVQRPRPTAGMVIVIDTLNSYSFPSGHVMYYLGFFGFIGFLVFCLLKPSIKRSLLLALIGIPIILIGISRIYLGEHWASDVLGSYLLGGLTLVATIQLYRWGKTRFFVHQPVAAVGSLPA
jgi:membrane-associated phospholipid phosphatase